MVISEDLWIDRLGFEAAHHPRFTPTEIPGLTDVEDVCAGRIFSLALLKNGTVLTWGQQYGAESVTDFYQLPSEVDPPEAGQWNGRVVGIACGATYSAVWTDKGALYTWGSLSGSTNLKQLKEKGNLQKRPPMAMACHPPGKEGIPRPTQVEHLRDVKVLGAVGHRNHLLVIPEDRGMFFLCSNHAGLGKPEDEQKSTAPPAQRFVLRSAGGIENPKVVGVALGDLPGANVTLRFVLLILEGNGRRRLFALDPDGKQELIEQGTPLYEVKFSDNGVPLDVVEVSVQKNRALVLLSDSTVKVLTLYLVDDQVFFGEPMPVEALRNSSLKLPKAISLGTNWIVITRTGPKGPFLPKEELAWGRGQYGIGRYKSSESLRTFEPLERPALAKGGCEVPPEWLPTPNGTSSRSSTLPLFITGMSYVSPLNVEFPFNPEAPVGLKWQLHFDCPTGVLSSTKAHCMNLYDRAVFSPNSTELFCTGCAVPDFRSSEVFPLRVEVRKKTEDGDHSAETAGTEAEGEEGWREYEKGEAIGVGDRLRLLCDSGTLAAAATESAVSDRKADEQLSSSGVECQWRDEKDKQKRTEYPTFKDTQDTSYLFCSE
uniref:Uncharacterized protein n=1 Tax=Chromera velia CCMP2878 TaxID=1169474 RepID=A0A0G4GCT0_9ALVE|eukprot:Cvel_4531.t1-p1 / transcript=Cvel_4531.t1 / gene=Cvel_4531 / organism=Chromera_velia_CCMP2878 / gene_product=hypothetical protein / transcript_product=hypothetical protein / location=Cvel_scaffold198:85943-91048(+) / protein_length=598 / sequence_SO=supercontig / SO=protein_coding / is_pseudo=false